MSDYHLWFFIILIMLVVSKAVRRSRRRIAASKGMGGLVRERPRIFVRSWGGRWGGRTQDFHKVRPGGSGRAPNIRHFITMFISITFQSSSLSSSSWLIIIIIISHHHYHHHWSAWNLRLGLKVISFDIYIQYIQYIQYKLWWCDDLKTQNIDESCDVWQLKSIKYRCKVVSSSLSRGGVKPPPLLFDPRSR